MEVTKIEPLKCPTCGSSACGRLGKRKIICDDCKNEHELFDTEVKTKKIDTPRSGKGQDPRYHTGDYIN